MIPAGRKRKLVAAVAKRGAQGMLVTNLADVRYLCGFTGSNAALAMVGGRATLFTDGRYTSQAQAEVDGAKVVIAERNVVGAACASMVERGVERCGFDETVTTVAGLDAMRAGLPAKLRKSWFVGVGAVVARLREVKDEHEQDALREAAALGVKLFNDCLEYIVPGATEHEVALALEYMARLAGAERMSFETIVASGQRSALPHGRATGAKLPRRGLVTLDFGVVLNGYCSDMTRTVHLGKARPGEREVYEAVLQAQEAGVAAVRAGVVASEVDAACRDSLTAAGYGEWFTHSTGHGVGLEIHEGPRIGKTAVPLKGEAPVAPVRLKAGMVVTIEPGAYLPGKFGVRIEDTVLVTAEGCEVLTPATKAWIEL